MKIDDFFIVVLCCVFTSCETENVNYNPALEGTYLCEAHITTPGGCWNVDDEDIWCPVGMSGFTETSEQVFDSIIQLSFDSESTFVINDFEELSQVNLNEDMSILLSETSNSGGLLYGYFHNEDSLTIYRKIIKPSYDMPRITSTYSEVIDSYYCVKQY